MGDFLAERYGQCWYYVMNNYTEYDYFRAVIKVEACNKNMDNDKN